MRHECKAKQEEESETLEETTGSGSGGTETESNQPTEGILAETGVEGSGNEIKEEIIREDYNGATDTDAVESVDDEILSENSKIQKAFLNEDEKAPGSNIAQSRTHVESEEVQEGETIVHYFYRGVSNLENVLRPHHCNPSPLCMVIFAG